MRNKVFFKKIIFYLIIVFIIFLTFYIILNNYFYKKYNKNYNEKISSIIYVLKEKYPDITDKEIASILNSEELSYDLKKYGINVDSESIVYENDRLNNKLIITNSISLGLLFIAVLLLYLKYIKYEKSKVFEINKMIEEIFLGNYEVDFKSRSEDELSIFRDNLYKISLKLKEESNNSLKDKIELKESLENISHQLKTPLTAISISIDNLLDSNSIKEDKRKEFLIDIKKETSNINFLVKSLLELSKFDVNVVKFERKNNNILDIIHESSKRVDLLRDLKNIEIIINGKDEIVMCDFNWEVEAISNIIKNAIEHCSDGSKIKIDIDSNEIYTSVKISNNGNTISEEDLNNIFKRFYSGKNSTSDSIGIGLSLAKSIINKDNGKIFADSKSGLTIFEIKYYK